MQVMPSLNVYKSRGENDHLKTTMESTTMMDKQVESCIMNMSCDKLCEIIFSPKLDLTRFWPCSVKSQTLVKGTMGMMGCVMRVEMHDNSWCECEIMMVDPSKFKMKYKILKSSKPCYKDCDVECTVRMRPVTFCGCPFLQAIHDKEVEKSCTMMEMPVKASQKTYLEWKTKCSKPIPKDMMEMVRSDKLTILSDMMKDMSGEQALMNMKRKMTDMDMYVAKKIGSAGDMKLPGKCPMGQLYTYDQAKMDAARYVQSDPTKGCSSTSP